MYIAHGVKYGHAGRKLNIIKFSLSQDTVFGMWRGISIPEVLAVPIHGWSKQ